MIQQIINFIQSWQQTNDKDFQILPIDEKANLIFSFKQMEIKFTFSNETLMHSCYHQIPKDYLQTFDFIAKEDNNLKIYAMED